MSGEGRKAGEEDRKVSVEGGKVSKESVVDSPTATVTRILDATREDVFDAWTDLEQARQWMCPVGATVPDLTLEARVGGRLRLVMRVDGRDFIHLGEFLEVERPRRLVFTWITMYTRYRKSVVTVEFLPVDGRTELRDRAERHDHTELDDRTARRNRTEVRITHVLLPDEELAEAHRKGWEGLLDHLEIRLSR